MEEQATCLFLGTVWETERNKTSEAEHFPTDTLRKAFKQKHLQHNCTENVQFDLLHLSE